MSDEYRVAPAYMLPENHELASDSGVAAITQTQDWLATSNDVSLGYQLIVSRHLDHDLRDAASIFETRPGSSSPPQPSCVQSRRISSPY